MFHNHIYILEGPDGSGKTTLANKICEKYKIPRMHLTYYMDQEQHQAQFDLVEKKLDEYIDGTAETGICFDRFIFSTKVYGDVFNNNSSIDNYDEILIKIEYLNKMYTGGVHLIFTLPQPKELYIENFNKIKARREELYTDTELMSKVYDRFDDIYHQILDKKFIRDVRVYDYANDKPSDLIY